MKKRLSVTALAAAIATLPAGAQDLEERVSSIEESLIGATEVSIGGYVKLDAQMSRFNRGNRAAAGIGDDFMVPSTIPTDGSNSQINNDFHAKESRINFGTSTETDAGEVSTFIEVDFLGSAQGDERVTNSYSPRLRHAFLTFNDFTFGQTWTTFMDVRSLPEHLDFVGPVAHDFARNPQIRYSPGNWDFALENPESTVYTNEVGRNTAEADEDIDEIGLTASYDNNRVPDAVVRYNVPVDTGSLSLSAIGREIAYSDSVLNDGDSSRESAYGYGLAANARLPVGDTGNDVRVKLSGGNAMGRYLGLNAFRAAQIEEDGDVDLIDQFGATVAYHHNWNTQWRSNVSGSYAEADNPSSAADGVAKSYSSAHANLIYSPVENLDLGGELIWGQRENENGVRGELNRVQFSAKLGF